MSKLKLIGAGLAVLFTAILFLSTYFTVDQTQRAVVTHWGALSYVADPGIHFKIPFADSTVMYPVGVQEVSPSKGVNTYTVDNQEVDVVFNVFFRIDPDKVGFVYSNVPGYRDRLYSMAIDRLKAALGKVNVSSVAEKRGELRDAIKSTLADAAKSLGIEVTDFQLTDMQYTDSYRQAIGQAAASKAGVEAQEYVRQQALKTAETAAINAEGAANAVRAKAKGDADALLLNATAQAKATQLDGEAKATAIKAQADALSANPRLIELHKADRWDGQLPKSMLSNVMPFMSVDAAIVGNK